MRHSGSLCAHVGGGDAADQTPLSLEAAAAQAQGRGGVEGTFGYGGTRNWKLECIMKSIWYYFPLVKTTLDDNIFLNSCI